jgi:hypothetical protein
MDNKQLSATIGQQISSNNSAKTGMRIGVITSYNAFTNTATVILSEPDSDAVDEIVTDVPCPTSIGVQLTAPEPGRMCVVLFKNGAITQPLIVSYFNHSYRKFDYVKQNRAGYTLPTYLVSM